MRGWSGGRYEAAERAIPLTDGVGTLGEVDVLLLLTGGLAGGLVLSARRHRSDWVPQNIIT